MKLICASSISSSVVLCILFAISGTSIASAHDLRSSARFSTPNDESAHDPCSNPVVLSTGGLRCPLSPLSAGKCSRSRAGAVGQAMSKMKPLAVNGVIIPLPIVAQLVKKGLRRSWSPSNGARNLIACGYGTSSELRGVNSISSRIQVFHCLSNKAHFRSPVSEHLNYNPNKSNIRCHASCFLTQGNIAASVVRYVDPNAHQARVIGSPVNQMPTSEAAYSLRVPEAVPMQFPSLHKIINVPVFVTFTIKNGDLADVELARRNGNTGITTN